MLDELIDLLRQTTDLNNLKAILDQYQPYDIAMALEYLDEDILKRIAKALTPEELAVIVAYIDEEDAPDYLKLLPKDQIIAILNEMEADDVKDILDEVSEEQAEELTELLDEDLQDDLEVIEQYEEGTAGSLMNPHFLAINQGLSVKAAMKKIISLAPEVETIDPIFVVDDTNKLLGVLDLKELICARMPKTVDDVMLANFKAVETKDDNDTVVNTVRDYGLKALPVLEDGIIKGIITMDDAFDTLTEEAEEDYAKLAGLTEDEEDDESIVSSVKKRIPWLSILLVLDIVIALVISNFEGVIANLTILTFFQAAVLGLAGNCGTQALAVCVRKIAEGSVENKNAIKKHIAKELLQGVGTGIVLGILSFGFSVLMLLIKNTGSMDFTLKVGLVLGLAVSISVVLSNVFGTFLPIFFYKIHIDPAVASGPFITTINDIVAVLVYYGMAIILMANYL